MSEPLLFAPIKGELKETDHGVPQPSGPVFEFGPGWGSKIKKWIKKYAFGGDCTLCRNTRYILLFGIIILLIAGPRLKSLVNKQDEQKTISKDIVTETVESGDSRTKIARKALAKYLIDYPDLKLTNGQKIFVEEALQKTIDKNLIAGAQIEFSIYDINSAIEQSSMLTKSQLKKWEGYAKKVKF